MGKYWEDERPDTVKTARNTLQLYVEAEKLAIQRPAWTDSDGNEKQGKTVTLDIRAFDDCDKETLETARDMFAFVIGKIDEWIAKHNQG